MIDSSGLYKDFYCALKRIRTATVARHPLKMVRLPISPPGQLVAKITKPC